MIIGMRGCGKSTLFKHILNAYKSKGWNILVYDTLREHGEFKRYIPQDIGDVEEFDKICERVMKEAPIIFGIEEIDLYASPQSISPKLKQLIAIGRHYDIGLVMVTRRIADVHKLPCSQTHHWFIFKTYLPNDIVYLRQFVGDIVYKAIDLPPFHFIYWSGGEAKICKPIKL